jgi:hypothetical protein
LWAREERTTETFVFEQANLRARLHGWLGSLREGTTKVYRLLAPTWLRDARRDLYQRIRFERADR